MTAWADYVVPNGAVCTAVEQYDPKPPTKAYRRGKRKRLRCRQQSSDRYLCTFSFRYRKGRQAGTVTVARKPNGSATARVKRR
jgi:hypothetical protein